MSRALQINSSPQGWMARNTKPIPLAEKGWVITMKRISIILLSAVLVFSMAACKPKWEDTITNRMLHWSYTPEQKEELKMALAAGVPKATILTYFYPEVTAEKMSSYRMKQ